MASRIGDVGIDDKYLLVGMITAYSKVTPVHFQQGAVAPDLAAAFNSLFVVGSGLGYDVPRMGLSFKKNGDLQSAVLLALDAVCKAGWVVLSKPGSLNIGPEVDAFDAAYATLAAAYEAATDA